MNILCSLCSTVVAVGIGTILDWFPNYCTPFVTSGMFGDIFMIHNECHKDELGKVWHLMNGIEHILFIVH